MLAELCGHRVDLAGRHGDHRAGVLCHDGGGGGRPAGGQQRVVLAEEVRGARQCFGA
ncbi:MAG: hypothetical protein QOC64_3227, partial [Solirubrobacteraceae bacterium]|nr:hypothetical protein [Solirubrobacteraceae bacterium]